MVPMLAGMLLPVFLSALPHYINLKLAAPEIYTVDLPVAEKSRLRRTPRGGPSFLLYRLHVTFNDIRIGDETLNGPHIVFVPEETYNTLRTGDTFRISLRAGPLAPFMLQTDTTVNMVR